MHSAQFDRHGFQLHAIGQVLMKFNCQVRDILPSGLVWALMYSSFPVSCAQALSRGLYLLRGG